MSTYVDPNCYQAGNILNYQFPYEQYELSADYYWAQNVADAHNAGQCGCGR